MEHLICTVFKSSKKDECYLYVNKKKGVECLPEALSELFGSPIEVMTLLLTEQKKLARVDVKKVIDALQDQGYYLQLPPPLESDMQAIHLLNDKIPR